MKVHRAIGFLIIAILCACELQAQVRITPKERRANKKFQEGSYYKAIRKYHKVLQRNPANHRVKLKLAESYFQLNDTENAEEYFSEVINKPFIIKSPHYLQYAQVLQSNEDFTRSMRWTKKYLAANPKSEVAQNLLFSLQHISKYYIDSSKYTVIPLNINTGASEFSPAYYGSGITFSSSRRKGINLEATYQRDCSKYLDLYVTEPLLGQNMFTMPRKLKGKVNSRLHEGPAALMESGTRIIFTRNQQSKLNPQQTNRLNLYTATRQLESDPWKKVTPLPFNNKNYSVGHPTVDPSGAIMYFVSDMPGGYGGTDLYKVLYVRGKWGVPTNLGKQINTPGNEMFPFIAANDVLYFASNGHPGLGGLDIYRADLKQENTVVDNLGYPVNSTKDDFGFIIKEGSGYFSSNRSGNDDIYRFNKESKIIDLLVEVTNPQETMVILRSEGSDLSTQTLDPAGRIRFDLAPDIPYEVAVESPGYYPEVVSLSAEHQGNSIKLTMTPQTIARQSATLLQVMDYSDTATYILTDEAAIEIGNQPTTNEQQKWLQSLLEENNVEITDSVRVEPIHYGFDESQVETPYLNDLDNLAQLMLKYKYLEFQLKSHTDSRGTSSYNLNLSEKRAASARNYLIENGISSQRLLAHGYGERHLINACADGRSCTRSQHLANRRTEFGLIHMGKDQIVSNY